MTGLMIIFLFVCLGFMYTLNHNRQQYNIVHDQIYEDLNTEFKPDEVARWGAKIDKDTLTVTFIEPTVFFEKGDTTVNEHFQEVLADFFPRYVKVLQKYSDDIVEVRIEGNASREWDGDPDSTEAYYSNMQLSQGRAFNVLTYVYGLDSMSEYRPWLREKLRANGASYSKASDSNSAASRSVEISIRRNAEGILEKGWMK